VNVLAAGWFRPRLLIGNTGQNNRRTIGEFSDKREVSAHGLDGLPKRGQQQIAALFEARNAVLGDTESLSHADLRELARVPKLAQGHLLGNQLSGASFDFLALSGAQFLDYVIHVSGHGLFPFRFQPGKVSLETVIGLSDQLAVEPFFTPA
jgi:hypothetical protein